MPPHIVLQKIARKLKHKLVARKKKFLDEKFPTFARNCPYSTLNRFVKPLDLSLLPAEKIHQQNQHFLKHEFDLLGSGWVEVCHGMNCKGLEEFYYPPAEQGKINEKNLSESERIKSLIQGPYLAIDWHIDFKSGYRWHEDTWSQNIQYGSELGADVKVPWELSRMQHLISLAWGYALEKKDLYRIEFQNQILDFISSNPPRYGVNWSCTMDVGIRIANWLMAFDLFSAYGAQFDPEFEKTFIRSVYEHGHHIRNHLEWDPYLRSNHYLANIAGLLFVSAYLDADWFDFSIRELVNETLIQFHPDGSNFEASTCYHRLSAEMVVYATALAIEKKVQFPQEYLRRIHKMGDFIRDITKPDGAIVQLGDHDSGRFFKVFPDLDILDHRYLVSSIRNLKGLSSLFDAQLKPMSEKEDKLSAYSDFGLYIQRNGPWYLAVRCGSVGQQGNGGHAHNDQLSFELAVKGVSMIVDSGTYVYTPIPKARRHFRSTAMHNTLAIGGREQNKDEGLFKMTDKAKARMIEFREGIFVGEHEGFGPIHRRTLKTEDFILHGIDECEAGQIYFHFAPGWEGAIVDESTTEWSFEAVKVRLSGQGIWRLEDYEYSRAYGEKIKARLVILKSDFKQAKWKIEVY